MPLDKPHLEVIQSDKDDLTGELIHEAQSQPTQVQLKTRFLVKSTLEQLLQVESLLVLLLLLFLPRVLDYELLYIP